MLQSRIGDSTVIPRKGVSAPLETPPFPQKRQKSSTELFAESTTKESQDETNSYYYPHNKRERRLFYFFALRR